MPELLTSCQLSQQLEAGLAAVGALASGATALLGHQAPLASHTPPAKTQQSLSSSMHQQNSKAGHQ